jgi:uncharacterized lipoprotein YajG
MKNLLFVLISIILAGCAGTIPEKADLDLEIADQPEGVYPASLDISVTGKDSRSEPHVILFKVDKETPMTLTSRVPPQVLARDSLVHGLRQQGLSRGDRSNIIATLNIKELLAKVTKPGVLYNTNVRTRIQLIVRNNGSVLTLEYNREANKDTLTRPKILDLEIILNEQLSEVLTKILSDDRVRVAIKKK